MGNILNFSTSSNQANDFNQSIFNAKKYQENPHLSLKNIRKKIFIEPT